MGSLPRAWRWLSEPKTEVKNLPVLTSTPDKMLHSLEGIEVVKQHALAFSQFKRAMK